MRGVVIYDRVTFAKHWHGAAQTTAMILTRPIDAAVVIGYFSRQIDTFTDETTHGDLLVVPEASGRRSSDGRQLFA